MADETKKVEYVYEGDVSSLRAATQTAIDMLSKYSASMKKASATKTFEASKKASNSMNASISRLTKDIEAMQEKLKGIGDVKLPSGSDAAKVMKDTLATISAQMRKLNSANTVTTKTLNGFKTQMNSVRDSLQQTSPQIDRLINSEQRFQKILSVVRGSTTKFHETIDIMKNKIASAFDPINNRLKGFSKTFDAVTIKVQSFKDKASAAFPRVSQLLDAVSEAFRRVSTTADSASAKSKKSHNDLEEAASDVAEAVKDETEELKKEKSSLDTKEQSLKRSRSSHSRLLQVITNLGARFRTETRSINLFASSTKSLNGISNILGKTLTALIGIKISDWLSQGVTEAIKYVENLNLFNVAMGETIDKGLEFVDTMAEIFGMDPSNLYRYTGYFYQLTDAIGMTDEASASLSLSMTKMSNDIASLFNVPIETAVENLASGLQGMSRSVRKYGMDIRATTLQQTAFRYGITAQVETMSEANRMALRFITMMEQVSNATQQLGTDIDGANAIMGDFARNIETPANQLRIFKEQMNQLGRAIGNFIIAPLSRALPYINGFIMALRMAINFVASLFGILSTEVRDVDTVDAVDSVGAIGAAADDASKKLKSLLAPFDELNVLQEQSASGGSMGFDNVLDPALQKAIEDMELKLDNIRMKANDVRDALLGFFGFKIDAGEIISWDSKQFEANLIKKFPKWTKTIKTAFDNWSKFVEAFKNLFKSISGVVEEVAQRVSDFLGIFINDTSVSTFITNFIDGLQALADWISDHEELLATFGTGLLAILGAFTAFQALQPLITLLTTFSTVLQTIGTLFTPFNTIALAVVGTLALLYANSDAFATSFQNLFGILWSSLGTIGASLIDLLTAIGTSLVTLWNDSVQPTLQALGDSFAPILDTLGSLWLNVSDIIVGTFELISKIWTNTLVPVFEGLFEAIQAIGNVANNLWVEILGPVLEKIGKGISDLWNNTLSPIVEKVFAVVGNLVEAILGLWNNVLIPIVNWLVDAFGPSIKNILGTIWNVISQLISDIGSVIEGLLTALEGITDFLAGVFTGDWERAWKGLVNIFIGMGNAIIGAFQFAINGIISLVNSVVSLVFNAVVGFVNSILATIEDIAQFVGIELELRIKAAPPAIPSVSFPRIPEMAKGGVVTGPTILEAGEGLYDEAIIPLGNSPQMEELVQRIADAVDKDSPNSNGGSSVEVHVYLGGKEVDAEIYQSARRGEKIVGAQPVKVEG